MNKLYDVAIIGAGPSGTSAAMMLARQGYSVVIVEMKSFPRYKVCGGGVLSRAKSLLPVDCHFTIESCVNSICLGLPYLESDIEVRRYEPLVYMVMRDEFDHSLLKYAVQTGAELQTNCKINSIDFNDSHIEIKNQFHSIKSRFLIAADGASGITRRTLMKKSKSKYIPAMEWEIQVNNDTFEKYKKTARFDYSAANKGYGWIFPKRSHLSVGILSNSPNNHSLKALGNQYIGKMIGEHNFISSRQYGYVIPTQPVRNLNLHSRVLLTGDAAGLVDPLTAEGITHAILSGQLAAKALKDSSLCSDKTALLYQRLLNQHILNELKYARILAKFFYHESFIKKIVMQKFAPVFCESMANVISGKRSYRELLSNPKKYYSLIHQLRRRTN